MMSRRMQSALCSTSCVQASTSREAWLQSRLVDSLAPAQCHVCRESAILTAFSDASHLTFMHRVLHMYNRRDVQVSPVPVMQIGQPRWCSAVPERCRAC
jgi:hypothetical protein